MSRRLLVIIGAVVIVVAGGALIVMHMSKATASSGTKVTNASAVNNAVLITKTSSAVAEYLADPSGKALYAYSQDANGMSNCTGSCLSTWPAYVDSGSTTSLPSGVGTITRSDNGKTQYTYNGLPLYYFVGDASGGATGDDVSGFHLAKPMPPQAASAPAAATAAPTSAPAASQSSSSSSW